MKLTRLALVAATAATVASTALLTASPASAVGLSAGCSSINATGSFTDDQNYVETSGGLVFNPGEYVYVDANFPGGTVVSGLTWTMEVQGYADPWTNYYTSPRIDVKGTLEYQVPEAGLPQPVRLYLNPSRVEGSDTVAWTVSCSAGARDSGPFQLGDFATNATPPTKIYWHQAYGRSSREEKCLEGWMPSYAQWMNDHRGGWTCEKDVLAFG